MNCYRCGQPLSTSDTSYPDGLCSTCRWRGPVPNMPRLITPPRRDNTAELRKVCPMCGGCGTIQVAHTTEGTE